MSQRMFESVLNLREETFLVYKFLVAQSTQAFRKSIDLGAGNLQEHALGKRPCNYCRRLNRALLVLSQPVYSRGQD